MNRETAAESRSKIPLILFFMIVLILLSACGVKPWVKPYERHLLADPIMSFSRDPVSAAYVAHVYQARESARGAEGSQGGGCGCN